MAEEITSLDSPIDVMYLLHKALSAEAARVQKTIEEFKTGDSLQTFRAVFNNWATVLMYHADVEDRYMTAPLTDSQAARVNEEEHADLAGLSDDLTSYMKRGDSRGLAERLRAAIVALHEERHTELLEKLEDVLAVLNGEIGRTRVIARTKRHLFGKVVALRICQDDHLESEEAFVLPEVRERMNETEQLELAGRLLIDEEAEEPNWILESVARDLTPRERMLLNDLRARVDTLSSVSGS